MNAFSDPFRHGVASGDPLHDRVVLWTCVTPPGDEPGDVASRVARDPPLEAVGPAGTSVAGERTDYTVHV